MSDERVTISAYCWNEVFITISHERCQDCQIYSRLPSRCWVFQTFTLEMTYFVCFNCLDSMSVCLHVEQIFDDFRLPLWRAFWVLAYFKIIIRIVYFAGLSSGRLIFSKPWPSKSWPIVWNTPRWTSCKGMQVCSFTNRFRWDSQFSWPICVRRNCAMSILCISLTW